MKKPLILIPLIVFLSGCIQDTTLEERQHAIQYNVVTENTTRALHSYSSNNKPTSFYVWAVNKEGNKYFGPDEIVNKGNYWSNNQDVIRYWPKSQELSFYALVDFTLPSESTNNKFFFEKEDIVEDGRPYISNFKVEAGVINQVDLMYAMAEQQEYSTSGVNLKFHHALSQIVFKAQNNTKDLNIQISKITLGDVASSGKFTFPVVATDKSETQPTGTWEPSDAEIKPYTVSVVNPDENSEYVTLTHLAETASTPNNIVNLTGAYTVDNVTHHEQVLNLIPQEKAPWNPTQKGEVYNGAYFKLTAIITHKDGPTELYRGNIVIPAEINWEPGKRYNYTFIFSAGTNGGYEDNPEDPQPVLTPLKYTIKVDDFIDVYNNNDMNAGDTPAPEDPKPTPGVTVTSPTATGSTY